jgi:hypothetical protein
MEMQPKEITKDILCAYLSGEKRYTGEGNDYSGEKQGNFIAKMYEIIYKKVSELEEKEYTK